MGPRARIGTSPHVHAPPSRPADACSQQVRRWFGRSITCVEDRPCRGGGNEPRSTACRGGLPHRARPRPRLLTRWGEYPADVLARRHAGNGVKPESRLEVLVVHRHDQLEHAGEEELGEARVAPRIAGVDVGGLFANLGEVVLEEFPRPGVRCRPWRSGWPLRPDRSRLSKLASRSAAAGLGPSKAGQGQERAGQVMKSGFVAYLVTL